ncbi:MAG: hypothetical protein AAGK09_14670, partial [Planctomycetota bacterium]
GAGLASPANDVSVEPSTDADASGKQKDEDTADRPPKTGGAYVVRNRPEQSPEAQPEETPETTSPVASIGIPAEPQVDDGFRVLTGIIRPDRPDFRDYGMQPVAMIYATRFWPWRIIEDYPRSELPKPSVLQKVGEDIAGARTDVACLNIEHWNPHLDTPASDLAIDRLIEIISRVREHAGGKSIGYYRLMPQRRVNDAQMNDWIRANERVQRLAEHVDIIFPSLYTFTNNEEAWEAYARRNIEMARQYGKPVYPFLWYRYHNSHRTLGERRIDAAYWRRQLELCRELADGVVIWDVSKEEWDDQEPWWQETLEFMDTLPSADTP